jgi:hypothetical protein
MGWCFRLRVLCRLSHVGTPAGGQGSMAVGVACLELGVSVV